MMMRRLILSVVWAGLLSCCGLFAAEKEILRFDLSNPARAELTGELWGKYQFDGDLITMGPGSKISSVQLPRNINESIRITFDAKCDRLEGEDFRVGWCTVTYYDESRQPIGHADLCQIRGTTQWRSFDVEVAPPDRCAYFTADFAHAGTAGEASYRNIRIFTDDHVAEDLIADSDFEDILGVNYFFFRRSGRDWDDFAYFAPKGEAVQDESIFTTGAKSLRLEGGGATLVSQEFPYEGEELIISAWERTSDDFKVAERAPWGGAGVQLVGLDENGKHLVHTDLFLMVSPSPWKYFERKVSFPGAVKKVQYFVRLFEGAQGRAWIDQLRLRWIPSGTVLPFDGKENALTVDLNSAEPGEINYRVWAGVDALYSSWLLREDVRQCFPYLKKAGIEMIRFREICNMLNMYPADNPDGTPAYNFEKFDQLFDLLVRENGFIPNITIGTTPPALARAGTIQSGWCNGTAPRDMEKWGAFIEAMFRHAVDRYGVDEVNKWYWEIWNEPVLPATHGDYVGSVDDFVALSMEIYLAKERVDAAYPGLNLRMGMTSGGQAGASDEYLFARLAEMGKLHLIRHRSRHYYSGIGEGIRMVSSRIRAMQEQGAQYGETDYESGCTEWNCTAMSSPYSDRPWNAAFAVKMVRMFLDAKLDYATFFGMVGHPEMPMPPDLFTASGDLSILTRTNDYRTGGYGTIKPVPKSVYNAFLMLNELRTGHRLNVERTAEPVDALAVAMPDGTLRVLLTNYDEDTGRQPYVTKVTLRFRGAAGRSYRCTRNYACDEEHGNAYGAWEKLGKPGIGDKEAVDAVIAEALAVELPCPEVVSDGEMFQVTIDLPSPGIRLLEFRAQ